MSRPNSIHYQDRQAGSSCRAPSTSTATRLAVGERDSSMTCLDGNPANRRRGRNVSMAAIAALVLCLSQIAGAAPAKWGRLQGTAPPSRSQQQQHQQCGWKHDWQPGARLGSAAGQRCAKPANAITAADADTQQPPCSVSTVRRGRSGGHPGGQSNDQLHGDPCRGRPGAARRHICAAPGLFERLDIHLPQQWTDHLCQWRIADLPHDV